MEAVGPDLEQTGRLVGNIAGIAKKIPGLGSSKSYPTTLIDEKTRKAIDRKEKRETIEG